MSTTLTTAPSTAAERIRRQVREKRVTRAPPQAMSTMRNKSVQTPNPNVRSKQTINQSLLRRLNNGKRLPSGGRKNNFKSRLGLMNNSTLRRANQNLGNTKGGVVRRVQKLFPETRQVSTSPRQLRETVAQLQLPGEHFVMMAKFLQFNKMTRTGMKDFTDSESKVYDSLIRMYNDLAKNKKNIN